MTEEKRVVKLDEDEASLALHALRFYMNAKGREVSANTERLEATLDQFLSGTTFVVTQVESVASILGARGGTKGGASTSEAKEPRPPLTAPKADAHLSQICLSNSLRRSGRSPTRNYSMSCIS